MSVRELETEFGMRFEASASLDSIQRVDEAVGRLIEARGWAVDAFAVRILLHESMMNAIVHGSGQDGGRTVTVDISADDRGLELVVADEGEGFDLERMQTPVDVLADGGRGIPLMRIYADRVRHNAKGNVVTLYRHFSGSGAYRDFSGSGASADGPNGTRDTGGDRISGAESRGTPASWSATAGQGNNRSS